MVAVHVINNYPAIYGTLSLNTITQQLITGLYMNQMITVHLLSNYPAIYGTLNLNTVSQQLTTGPYLNQMNPV
jgi:hypothetical protein